MRALVLGGPRRRESSSALAWTRGDPARVRPLAVRRYRRGGPPGRAPVRCGRPDRPRRASPAPHRGPGRGPPGFAAAPVPPPRAPRPGRRWAMDTRAIPASHAPTARRRRGGRGGRRRRGSTQPDLVASARRPPASPGAARGMARLRARGRPRPARPEPASSASPAPGGSAPRSSHRRRLPREAVPADRLRAQELAAGASRRRASASARRMPRRPPGNPHAPAASHVARSWLRLRTPRWARGSGDPALHSPAHPRPALPDHPARA